MKLPKKKKIKGRVWKIREVFEPIDDDGQVCWGVCDYDNRIIYIKKTLAKDQKLATYLHEVLHASFHELGLDMTPKKDEEIVQGLEDIILRLFRIVPR